MGGSIVDNAAKRETERLFGSLAARFDRRTRHVLGQTGVGLGWRCLEIGGGGGSIAAQLADRVGDAGHVTVTDIDPRFLTALASLGRPNLEVLRHGVTADLPPEAAYDRIHARLVFSHLPGARGAGARRRGAQAGRLAPDRGLRPVCWLTNPAEATRLDREPAQRASSRIRSPPSPPSTVSSTTRRSST